MQFFSNLYALVIGPIELIFKVIFSLLNKNIPVSGVNILLLSLVFSLMVLPLYMRADKIQEEAREQEDRLGPTIKHIKKYFKGDERFMILQTFYRQNDYSPLSVLKSSVSLLLQVPFFLAAYRMLHDNMYLMGRSFGPIKDLGSPDSLLVIGGVAINVLPFVMTAINLLSAAVYANKMPLKSKIQLWVMAALFLVLLYRSPSGMVIYWTCNNIFSLVKNIINRIISSKKTAKAEKKAKEEKKGKAGKPVTSYKAVFFFSCLTCAVYIGFYIPMLTVGSAAEEFTNLYTMAHPMLDVLECVCKGLGLFVLWPSIFYAMASKGGRKIMAYFMFILACSSILNSKLFSNGFGDMSSTLIYDSKPEFTVKAILLSLAVTLGAIVFGFLLVRFGKNITPVIAFSAALVFVVLGFMNLGKVDKGYKEVFRSETSKAEIPLSKNGKNVVVLMCDRAIGPMLPYIFKEKSKLNETYDGFVYYHNTASYGTHTNFAIPSLLGGYEYTPEALNKRSDKLLAEKHDEALKVMPKLFTDAGYNATIINPKYAGYQWYPDLSVFNELKNTKAYSTKYSDLPDDIREGYKEEQTVTFRYNLFCYSIFRSAPVALQNMLYDNGIYNETRIVLPSRMLDQKRTGNSKSEGHEQGFMWSYYTMKAINDMTKVDEGSTNNFVYFGTDMTHDTEFLQEPEYEPRDVVDNTKYDKTHTTRFLYKSEMMWIHDAKDFRHYQCNLATLVAIGKWLDHLKEIGCYDNTRIIIVSDHGYYIENFVNLLQYDIGAKLDGEAFAPLLMVKDFGAHGKIQTSEEFMTTADTPYLATKDVISNPVNPYTGKPITDQGKANGITVFDSDKWKVQINNGTAYLPGDWYSLKDSIWKKENWKYLGNY